MTTIAVRDGVMASDSLETEDETVITDKCKKIWRLPDGSLLGAAKCSEDCWRLYDALRKKQPIPKLDEVIAVRLYPSGKMELFEGNVWQPITTPYYAIGNGSKYAWAAMDAGADAIKACRIGIKRDVYSGGRLQVLRLPQGKQKEREAVGRFVAEKGYLSRRHSKRRRRARAAGTSRGGR